jgi:putative spermidine/putrescine transport system substrate-binding protein
MARALDRRGFMRGAVSGLLTSPLLSSCDSHNSVRALTLAASGGVFADSQDRAFLRPFGAREHVPTQLSGPINLAKLRNIVSAGRQKWDVVSLDGRAHWRAAQDALIVPLDYDLLPAAFDLPALFRTPYGVVTSTGASMLCWRRGSFGLRRPERWSDLWNTGRFPGRRAMYRELYWNYEVAMLAEGVRSDEIYPVTGMKMKVALERLAALKPHVAVWWAEGPQVPQLLTSGEVTLSSGWSGRIFSALDGGAPLDYTMNQALAWGTHFSIVAGSPSKALAHRFLNYCVSLPAQQAMRLLNVYGPSLPSAAAGDVSGTRRDRLVMADEVRQSVHFLNDREGAAYSAKYDEQWNQLLLG